jgi:hypothetical protein
MTAAIYTDIFDPIIESVNTETGEWSVVVEEESIDMGNEGYGVAVEASQEVLVTAIIKGSTVPTTPDECRITRFEVFTPNMDDALDLEAYRLQNWAELMTLLKQDVAITINNS